MAQTITRQRIIGNPGRRKRHARRRSRNPGEILGFVLGPTAGNPGRKRGNMAKAKRNRGKAKTNRHHRRRGNPGMHVRRNRHHAVHHHRRRRHNPGMRRNRHHHHRRNPGDFGGIGPMLTNAVFVIVGALGSKLGAQALLKSANASHAAPKRAPEATHGA